MLNRKLSKSNYNVSGNAALLNLREDDNNNFGGFVTNTEKVNNIPTHFRFPGLTTGVDPIEIYGKVKIGLAKVISLLFLLLVPM